MLRSIHRAGLLALLTLAAGPVWPASEGELRVAMIYNIARFVQWPEAALRNGPHFRVCTVGNDGVIDALGLLTDKPLHGRPISVHPVRRDSDLDGCHIVYIASREALRLAVIREQFAASRSAVLTVGDAPGFIAGGGMVQLLTLEGRQRFRINHQAAEHSGLNVNAKLLQLALPLGDQ